MMRCSRVSSRRSTQTWHCRSRSARQSHFLRRIRFEQLKLRYRPFPPVRFSDGIKEDIERPFSGQFRVELAQTSGGSIAGIYELLLALLPTRLVEDSGEPVTVASMERNYIVGEIAVLIDVPRTATVVATSKLTTLKLTKELFFQLIADFPEVALEVIRVLAAYAEQGAIALAKQQRMSSAADKPPR